MNMRSELDIGPTMSAGRRLARCKSGAAAVEFALVAMPFIGLLSALLQVPIVFFAQQTLQTATTEAARLIMTGQAQSAKLTAAQFQNQVCADAGSLFTCGNIYVNVQKFSSFSSVKMLNPVKDGVFDGSTMNYDPGSQGDIEIVQVFYQWPVYAAFGFNLSNLSSGNDLLVATAAIRNEP